MVIYAPRDPSVSPGSRLGYFSRNIETLLSSPLPQSLLTVFTSPDSRVLRFQLTTENPAREQYSFELATDTHRLVIAYADPSGPNRIGDNVMYIQQTPPKDADLSKQIPLWERPGIKFMCRFDSISDVAEFQAALLGESLNLAISHVHSVCYALQPNETVRRDRCGIQIWHEARSSPAMRSNAPSRIVNGTRLAGRPMEGTRPRLTRVVVFLPREEEHLFFFVTHDIELVENGDDYRLSALIQPRRKSCSLLRGRGGSSFLKLWHVRRTACAAGGFLLSAPAPDLESDESYQRCNSLEIGFESKQEYKDFIDIWRQAVCFRYETKKVLRGVERQMSRERYMGKDAVRLRF
ncbi:hypothetical protein B0H67DRAFT_646078 [Lasiosphaeris hirsuta]|uniref:Uncharacterized protein n=1 Tax=Lasiosphaeris hirsuta TaxID=260670 RepID=A0AA40A7M0_9PEZI|nr:hypothetical protein B0H67DRAFT_646078 [Lasiosphaeris hirsuta]